MPERDPSPADRAHRPRRDGRPAELLRLPAVRHRRSGRTRSIPLELQRDVDPAAQLYHESGFPDAEVRYDVGTTRRRTDRASPSSSARARRWCSRRSVYRRRRRPLPVPPELEPTLGGAHARSSGRSRSGSAQIELQGIAARRRPVVPARRVPVRHGASRWPLVDTAANRADVTGRGSPGSAHPDPRDRGDRQRDRPGAAPHPPAAGRAGRLVRRRASWSRAASSSCRWTSCGSHCSTCRARPPTTRARCVRLERHRESAEPAERRRRLRVRRRA